MSGIEKNQNLSSLMCLAPSSQNVGKGKNDRGFLLNLKALKVWETYISEGEKIQARNEKGGLPQFVAYVQYKAGDHNTLHDARRTKWGVERELVAKLFENIQTGEAQNLEMALRQVYKTSTGVLKDRAAYYLDWELRSAQGYSEGVILRYLIDYVSSKHPDPEIAKNLLHKTFEFESKTDAVEIPRAVYSFVKENETTPEIKAKAQKEFLALHGQAKLTRSLVKEIRSINLLKTAAEVTAMQWALGLSWKAYDWGLAYFRAKKILGWKGILGATGIWAGAEFPLLFGLNTAQDVLLHDVKAATNPKQLNKNLWATAIMVAGLKAAGLGGRVVGPQMARQLGMLKAGEEVLTAGGRALVSTVHHLFGIGGMVGSTKINQKIGLRELPVGGHNESLAHDLVSYAKYATAGRLVDYAVGVGTKQCFAPTSLRLHQKIAIKEAQMLAEGAIEKWGYSLKSAEENPAQKFVRETLANKVTEAQLMKVGFSVGKLSRLIQKKLFAQANRYLEKFNLPLQVKGYQDGSLLVIAWESNSPQQAIQTALSTFGLTYEQAIDPQAIKRQFRKIVRERHSDLGGGQDAEIKTLKTYKEILLHLVAGERGNANEQQGVLEYLLGKGEAVSTPPVLSTPSGQDSSSETVSSYPLERISYAPKSMVGKFPANLEIINPPQTFGSSPAPTIFSPLATLGVAVGTFLSMGSAGGSKGMVSTFFTVVGLAFLGMIFKNGKGKSNPGLEIETAIRNRTQEVLVNLRHHYDQLNQFKIENPANLNLAIRLLQLMDFSEDVIGLRDLFHQFYQFGNLFRKGELEVQKLFEPHQKLKKKAPIIYLLAKEASVESRIVEEAKRLEFGKNIFQLEIYLTLLNTISHENMEPLELLLQSIKTPLLNFTKIPNIQDFVQKKISDAVKEFRLLGPEGVDVGINEMIDRLGKGFHFLRAVIEIPMDIFMESIELGAEDFPTGLNPFGKSGEIIPTLVGAGIGWEILTSGIAEAATKGMSHLVQSPGIGALFLGAGLLFGMAASRKKIKGKQHPSTQKEETENLKSKADQLYLKAISRNRRESSQALLELELLAPQSREAFEKILAVCEKSPRAFQNLQNLVLEHSFEPAFEAIVDFAKRTTKRGPITILFQFALGEDLLLANRSIEELVDIINHHLRQDNEVSEIHANYIMDEMTSIASDPHHPAKGIFLETLGDLAEINPFAAELIQRLEAGDIEASYIPDPADLEKKTPDPLKHQLILERRRGKQKDGITSDIVPETKNHETNLAIEDAERMDLGYSPQVWKMPNFFLVNSKPPQLTTYYEGELEGLKEVMMFPDLPPEIGRGSTKIMKVLNVDESQGVVILLTPQNEIMNFTYAPEDIPELETGKTVYLFIPEPSSIFSPPWMKKGIPLASLLILLDQALSSSPALASVQSAVGSLSQTSMTGWLTALGLTLGMAAVVSKKKSLTCIDKGIPKKKVATVQPFSLQLEKYEVSKQDAEDPLAKIGEIRAVKDSRERGLLHSQGFGFLIFKNAPFKIRGEGYEYCSRLMIYDPTTGISVDSHLPVEKTDLPIFRKDLKNLKIYLASLGVDLNKAKIHFIFGNGDDEKVSSYPGPMVVKELKQQGFKLTTAKPARGGDVKFDFDLKTGKVTQHSVYGSSF